MLSGRLGGPCRVLVAETSSPRLTSNCLPFPPPPAGPLLSLCARHPLCLSLCGPGRRSRSGAGLSSMVQPHEPVSHHLKNSCPCTSPSLRTRFFCLDPRLPLLPPEILPLPWRHPFHCSAFHKSLDRLDFLFPRDPPRWLTPPELMVRLGRQCWVAFSGSYSATQLLSKGKALEERSFTLCYRSLEGQICVGFTPDLTFLTHRWSSDWTGARTGPGRGCAQGGLPVTAGEERRPEANFSIPGPLTWVTFGPDLWASVYFPQGSWQPPSSLSLGSLPWR